MLASIVSGATALVLWAAVTGLIATVPLAQGVPHPMANLSEKTEDWSETRGNGAAAGTEADGLPAAGSTSGGTLTAEACPVTGCTSTYCHATYGQPPSASEAGRVR